MATKEIPVAAKKDQDQSYKAIVVRQFKKNRSAVWALRFLFVIIGVGVFADFLANEKPLYAKFEGETYFPVFNQYAIDLGIATKPERFNTIYNWKVDVDYESVIWPLVPYSPTSNDKLNRDYKGPFEEQRVESARFKHWMGTDKLGRDVLAGLIHGARVAMLVGIVSMSIASFIGIIMGAVAGYFGDDKLKVTRITLILMLLALPFAWFYGFQVRSYAIGDSLNEGLLVLLWQILLSVLIALAVFIVPYLISRPLKRFPALGKQITIPVDILVSRFIEIFVSLPSFLLILSIIAILKSPNLYLVMAIIGLTSWTGIARLIRGELLRVRNLEYIEAAHALGYSQARTIFRHAIPNSLTPVLISIAFGVAGAILTEAFLSFLGVGVPPEQVTWGSMLSAARGVPQAWWLAIFPGFAIFITVTIFNLMGEGLTDALDPRLKK